MSSHSIKIPKRYGASGAKRRSEDLEYNRLAGIIESYLNKEYEKHGAGVYPYDLICSDLKISYDSVSLILLAAGGGNTAIGLK